MFTLQILDAGQTFLHSIGAHPVLVGSAPDAQVRLHEAGVAERHAEFVPADGGVRLRAHADVRVNDAPVGEEGVALQLGDRIEIGRAVLVVGRTVARKAEPEDVLAGGVSRAGRRPRRASNRALPIAAGLLLAGGIVWFATRETDDAHVVTGRLADLVSWRNDGELDKVAAEIAQLRREWAAAADDRLARLDAAAAEVAAFAARREQLLAEVRDPAGTLSYREWFAQLQELEDHGAPMDRVAARFVRSRLRATLLERDEEAAQLAAPGRAATGGEVADLASPSVDVGPAIDFDDVERIAAQGLFAQALSLIQAGFDGVEDGAVIAALRERDLALRERARRALDELLAEAATVAGSGREADAVALLEQARHRFPSSGAFGALDRELRRLRAAGAVAGADGAAGGATGVAGSAAGAGAAPSVVDQATRLQTLTQLRTQMDAIRDAEERGSFADAAALLREAAAAVVGRDRDFAERLQARAAEADLLGGWNAHVVTVVGGGKALTVRDAAGRELTLARVDGQRLVARSADGEAAFAWYELDGAGVRDLVLKTRAKGEAALGAAALLYKQGETEAAELVLVDVVKQDAALLPKVNDVIARGRGEPVGESAYVLKKGAFVSERQLAVEELAAGMAARLAAAMRDRDPDARDAFVDEVRQQGSVQVEALAFTLREALDDARGKVDRSALRKQVDKMTELRAQLDAARDRARELIFDEVQYFYPYKPPAVSGEKHAEYNRVQQEVDQRVAALRDLWEDSRLTLRVPAKFTDELDRVDWLATTLAQLGRLPAGESVASLLAPLEWARALPAGTVGLKDFCLTPREKEQRERWRQVLAYNELVKGELNNAQSALLRITNEYRLMFGHRPLAAAITCMAAAQGHADEMSKLGYFSHMSPTPGRRTPYDRMRLAGYAFGASENIAMTGGAEAAHTAWCHSSGHHRNLLNAGHTELGIGANGRYWVENFGTGTVHRDHPAWGKVD